MGRKKPDNPEFVQEWEIPLLSACCHRPLTCCFFCFCPCVPIYDHRLRLIGDPSNYECCNGQLCCTQCLSPCVRPCPRFCLACEACCCTGTASMVNRDMIRDRYKLQVTPCEECIFCTLCLCECMFCVMRICGEEPPTCLENLVDCLFFSVMGCMNTQHEVELQKNGVIPSTMGMH